MDSRSGDPPQTMTGGAVTALRVRAGRADRTVVYLDEVAALEIATVVADEARLRVGMALTPEDMRALETQDEPHRARSRAVALLSARDRTAREVESRLGRLGFTPGTIVSTVEWLRERDYLNDRRFGEHYAAEKLRTGWADRRVSAELLRQGLDRGLVDEIMAVQRDDDTAACERDQSLKVLLRRRFGHQFVTDREGAERRMAGFLARRGYDWDTAGRMVRLLREEAQEAGACREREAAEGEE
jgi:regulatory protein